MRPVEEIALESDVPGGGSEVSDVIEELLKPEEEENIQRYCQRPPACSHGNADDGDLPSDIAYNA